MTHGRSPLRGLESTAQSSITTGKFGRMFRWLPPCFSPANAQDDLAIEQMLTSLAALMISSEFSDNVDEAFAKQTTPDPNPNPAIFPDSDITTSEPADENRHIAAGYTYLGQFIDHDITFDPTSSLQQQNDPDALEDFRTPRLDLDNMYGRGPDDQPYLYQRDGRHLFVLGADRGIDGQDRPDLQRTADDTAIIGDKRNDENKLVRQIHALFLKFHNRVFTTLDTGGADPQAAFAEAQRIVRWSYQYIVLNDFLTKVCRHEDVEAVLPLPGHREPRFAFYRAHDGNAFMPVEFSVAAYRFGHSMVRPSYALNRLASSPARFHSKGGHETGFARIPIFVMPTDGNPRNAMNGFGEPLPDAWGIDWDFFFGKVPGSATPDGQLQIPQPSYRIDTTLVDPLGQLPEFVPAFGLTSPFASLAFRNLMRGVSMGLPSGQAVARMMQIKPLTDDELWHRKADGDAVNPWPEGRALFDANTTLLEGRAPLWFYILKESELHERGHRLGRVGSRIVAETMIALAWYDHFSYLFQVPDWRPSDEDGLGLPGDLDMLGLANWVG